MKAGPSDVGGRFRARSQPAASLGFNFSIPLSVSHIGDRVFYKHPSCLLLNQHCVVSFHLCPSFLSRATNQYPDQPLILMP